MKTAIYLRQSLDRDENKLAIDRQREACLDLCRRKGWTDTVEYVDNDTSAVSNATKLEANRRSTTAGNRKALSGERRGQIDQSKRRLD